MKTLTTTWILFLIVLLAACGGDGARGESDAAVSQSAQEQARQSVQAAEPASQETAIGEPEEAVTESAADDTAPEAAGERTLLASLDSGGGAQETDRQWRYSAGKHYSELTAAQGTTDGAGGIEVAEVFWYGCPHCYSFDPYVERWEQQLPEDVRFVRIPVMWNPTYAVHARVFYTAKALGKLDEMHEAIFEAFHREQRPLVEKDKIRDFFGEFGVSAEEFDETYESFTVDKDLRQARSLTERYRVRSVPVLVVNGKYIVDGPEVKSFDDMIAVADELVERERQEM